MIYIASDHAGFDLKRDILYFFDDLGLKYEDIGPFEYDKNDDYPDYIIPAALKVAMDLENNVGIVLGGSGQGEAIAANKVEGIRCCLYYGGSEDIIKFSKTHNNSNMLSLGARFLEKEEALQGLKLWLETNYENDSRHNRRIQKITNYEKS